ncbi:MAG: O-antigen ligase family protein [Candidatus Acidiferrales bacterium]
MNSEVQRVWGPGEDRPQWGASVTQGMSQAVPVGAQNLWLVNIAGFVYAISMHKFATRDPLSANMGPQAIIEISCIVGAFVLIMCGTSKARRQYTPSIASTCFIIFGVFSLASSWRSFNLSLSFVKGVLFLVVLAAGYLVCQAGLSQQYFRSIYWGYITLLLVGLIIGILLPHQYPLFSVDAFSGRTRLCVFDTFPGVLGEQAGLILLIAPLIKFKIAWPSQAFLFLVNVFAGGKTSTFLLCALILVRFVVGVRQLRSWRTVAIVCVAGVIVSFSTLLQLGAIQPDHIIADSAESIYGTRVASEATSLDGRLALWTASLNTLQSAELLGFGLDGAREIMLKVAAWSGSTHNGYLELAVSGGLLGFAFFLYGLFAVLRDCFLAASPFRLHAFLLLTYMVINAVIGLIFSFPSYFGIFILLWLSYEAKTHTISYRAPSNSFGRSRDIC